MRLWEWLQKAAQHKYLRRIPTGKPRPRYRYIYSVGSKHHDAEHQVGEKVKITEGDAVGHFEVRAIHGDWVTLKHDESGQEVSVKKDRLLQMFHDEHVHKPKEESASAAKQAFRLTQEAQRDGSAAAHLSASMAHDRAADMGAEHAPQHRQLATAHVRAAAAIEGRQRARAYPPKVVLKLEKRPKPPLPGRLGTKQQAWDELLEAVQHDLPQEYTRANQRYLDWKARRVPKPPPYKGGELDAINEALDRRSPTRRQQQRGKTDTRVTSLREGFEKLTAGIGRWDDPRMKEVVRVLREVPGLERIRIPESAEQHALSRRAAAEQEAHYRDLHEAQKKQGVDTSFDPDEIGGRGAADTSFDFGWNVVEARKSMSGLDALGCFLEKSMYGPRIDDWAMQFSGTPLYQRALELTKEKLQLDGGMYGIAEAAPDPKKIKRRAKLDKECSELERRLIDHRIQQEKAMGKSEGDALGEYLEKAKYIRRTGTPGNYRYEYAGRSVPSRGAAREQEKTDTHKRNQLAGELMAMKQGVGTSIGDARKRARRLGLPENDGENVFNKLVQQGDLVELDKNPKFPKKPEHRVYYPKGGSKYTPEEERARTPEYFEELTADQQAVLSGKGKTQSYTSAYDALERMGFIDDSGQTTAAGIKLLEGRVKTHKSMRGIDALGDFLEKAETDGKPGESLQETSTDELRQTYGSVIQRLKEDPDDKGLQARYAAMDKELRRRGSHPDHKSPKFMEKALPSESADVSPEKARKILHDGEVHGHPLTEQQRKFFGAIASKGKARKSMDGITGLGEYLEKGHGASVAETVTSSPQHNLGDETGAISGDDVGGKGALPHGDTDFYGTSEADGDEEALKRRSGPTGANPQASGAADPGAMTSNNAANGGYTKSLPQGNLRQQEQVRQEHAQAMRELQKSDDVTVVGGDPTPVDDEPQMQMSKSWRQGDLVTYTDFSDRAASELVKGESFYHGPPPNPLASGAIQAYKECRNGHIMKAMFTACTICGDGSSINPVSGAGVGAGGLQKSMKGLQASHEEDLVLPAGTLIE